MQTHDDYQEQAAEYIVRLFNPNDPHKRLTGVGILTEDGSDLANQFEDPALIMAVANRLAVLAAELHDNEARNIDKVIDMFKGYPEGTTLGEILSGTAKKTLTAVEND